MGIDEILRRKQEESERKQREAAEASVKAQALRNEAYAQIEAGFLSAIRAI